MTMTALDVTTTTATANSIEAALTAAGILTTTHYKGSDYIIFTSTRSNKVIKVQVNGNIHVFFGDAYSSGTTITNQKTLSSQSGAIGSNSAYIIITPDVLAFTSKNSGAQNNASIFGTSQDGSTKVALGFTSYSTASGSNMYNTNDGTNFVTGMTLQAPLLTSSNTYYKADMFLKGSVSNQAVQIKGVSWFAKASDTTVAQTTYGSKDVVVPTIYTNGVSIVSSVMINNGML